MISVIVPVYNSDDNLETCLLSLVNQTMKNIEIIIVDDASCDNSRRIIEEFASKYSNIKVVYNNQNKGAGYSRNIGLSIARGEYIGFVDSDDYINSTMYEYMYNEACKNDYPDMVITGLKFVKNNDFALKDLSYATSDSSYEVKDKVDFIYDISPSVCNKLFKRELIEDYRFLEDCKWEDIVFTYYMYIKSKNVRVLNNPDYFYRRNINKGISGINYNKNNRIMEIFKVTDSLMCDASKLAYFHEYEDNLNLICFLYIMMRVMELEKWDCPDTEKQELKFKIFNEIYNRYGLLNTYDYALIASKISSDLYDEYVTFCDNYKNKVRKS